MWVLLLLAATAVIILLLAHAFWLIIPLVVAAAIWIILKTVLEMIHCKAVKLFNGVVGVAIYIIILWLITML